MGALPDAEAGVTGLTAQWKDSYRRDEVEACRSSSAFVLVFAFALMLVAFRSPVIAAKAIVLNLLSVGAAYGVLVLVFQHGVGKGLLGFSSTAGIDPVVPLLLFVILFGLSMDYHVFLLSRIREAVQRGCATDEAVAHGIKSTAGVVTSAAIVMVAVFAVFITLSMLMFKQFGVGLAAAILIDATIVRGSAPARLDEAARRLELVPAELARVAASVRRLGARDRSAGRPDPGAQRPLAAAPSQQQARAPTGARACACRDPAPPTSVGVGIVGRSERESGLPTRPSRRRARSVEACTRPQKEQP